MRKNIIYSGFNDDRVQIVDYLFKRHSWNPIFFFSRREMEEWSRTSYKNAMFYESNKLRNGEFLYDSFAHKIVPIDDKIIKSISDYESFSLDLVEDATGWNFSFDERRRYYYELLKFWNTVIVNLKPDIYISWTMPHVITDYVLYRLCKYYGIATLYYNPTPLFNHKGNRFQYVATSLEDQSKVFEEKYTSKEEYSLSEEVRDYFNSVRSSQGMVPPYISYVWTHDEKKWNKGFWKQPLEESYRLLKRFITGKFFEKIDVSWKWNKHPFGSYLSKMNYLQFLLFKERIRKQDAKLKKIYSSHTVNPDLNRKYIYYAAAFQPEAGIWSNYQDQFLIIDILSSTIPEDWVIYYKEHPSIFFPGDKASLKRSDEYYKKLATYKNVQMIPSETSSFPLIDAAQAVVTPSGTVGWEALVRGTPVLIFGSVWYQGCKSIFKIESLEDCQNAIERIKNGYRPDQTDIEHFAAVVEKCSEKNLVHSPFYQDLLKNCLNIGFEMERLAKLLYTTYEANFENSSMCDRESPLGTGYGKEFHK
jgi:hypothetical protein